MFRRYSQAAVAGAGRCRGLAAFGRLAAAGAVAFAALAVHAQTPILYKVIGADGKVTYTDRPVPSEGRAAPVAAATGSAPPASNPPLPIDLRQPVARYPVTLYVSQPDCEPCASARRLLRQRGVPYDERQVLTEEDARALERLTGGRDAPTLAIGSQILRGLTPEIWASYLDAAGYPRDSRLPPAYQYSPPTPLVARAPAAPPPATPAAVQGDGPTLPYLPNASGIRF